MMSPDQPLPPGFVLAPAHAPAGAASTLAFTPAAAPELHLPPSYPIGPIAPVASHPPQPPASLTPLLSGGSNTE